jgi:site-specific DNA recombinase
MMHSTNGHDPKRAILYTRVSGDSQRDHGYSLADQRRELEGWAKTEGYEILEIIEDGAWSGASLVRPGLDRVRELVRAGGVDAVVTLFRDRLARGVYAGLLAEEFAHQGCRLIALNAQVDDSPEGELHGGMLDIIAAWERKKIAERTRRGKLQKARQGKVVATHRPPFGFSYNATRDNCVVKPDEMWVVRRIFQMVAEGAAINGVRKALDREGVPTPGGARFWSEAMLRKILKNDLYRAHTYPELEALVSPEVAASLDPDGRYGVSWFGRRKVSQRQVAENGSYRTQTATTIRPREEQIAVPTPDPGIPRELVDAAREAIKDNLAPPSANHRVWELSGGIVHCGICGHRMQADTKRNRSGLYYYYRCIQHRKNGVAGCSNYKSFNAPKTEHRVWELVGGVLTAPEQLREDLERMIELEREEARDPEREANVLLDQLTKVERKRSAYQDQQAEGLITIEELRAKLASLQEARESLRRDLEALNCRREKIAQLERDKDALLEHYASIAPVALESLTSEERHHTYRILRLRAYVFPDGGLEVSGAFSDGPLTDPTDCAPLETPSSWSSEPSAAPLASQPARIARCRTRAAPGPR